MADLRLFAKLDLGYFENPKTGGLLESDPRVLILHLRAILYCRQHLTDGTFPIRQVVRLACASYCGSHCEGQCDVCKATQCGLFADLGRTTARVHDYLEHQDSAEQASRRKRAGQKAAAARWGNSDDADGNADGIANGNADGSAKGNAEKRREEKSSNAQARPTNPGVQAAFDEWWQHYPKKVAKGAAVKAYRAAVKKSDPAEILVGIKQQAPVMASGDPKFIPNPATWLNAERWTDEVNAPTPLMANGKPRVEGW